MRVLSKGNSNILPQLPKLRVKNNHERSEPGTQAPRSPIPKGCSTLNPQRKRTAGTAQKENPKNPHNPHNRRRSRPKTAYSANTVPQFQKNVFCGTGCMNRIKVSPLMGLVGFTGAPVVPWVKTCLQQAGPWLHRCRRSAAVRSRRKAFRLQGEAQCEWFRAFRAFRCKKKCPRAKRAKIHIIPRIGGSASPNTAYGADAVPQFQKNAFCGTGCMNQIQVPPLTGLGGFTEAPVVPWVKTCLHQAGPWLHRFRRSAAARSRRKAFRLQGEAQRKVS